MISDGMAINDSMLRIPVRLAFAVDAGGGGPSVAYAVAVAVVVVMAQKPVCGWEGEQATLTGREGWEDEA